MVVAALEAMLSAALLAWPCLGLLGGECPGEEVLRVDFVFSTVSEDRGGKWLRLGRRLQPLFALLALNSLAVAMSVRDLERCAAGQTLRHLKAASPLT